MEQAANGALRDPLIGTVLDERYRVLRRIGRGGMGIVYLAQHVLIGRKYAIKTLSERTNASEEMVARFRREAQAAAAVGSQHVVDVTDMGRLPDGTLYLVLEYLEGMDLGSAVRSEGRFSSARAVHVACQLCDALAAVHEKGIVHRDLKPENLFLIEQGGTRDFLKVLDFGICKLLEGSDSSADPDDAALTRTNASLGTPQYMAPEQFQTSAHADRRADIHAVGAILYFMLTGRPPFDAASVAQLYMRVCVEPPPLLAPQRPDLPHGLEHVIRRAMEKHPEDRYASSAELKAALLPFRGIAAESSPLRGQPTARELAGLSTPTQSAISRVIPVSSETQIPSSSGRAHAQILSPLGGGLGREHASVSDLTPRLPERRWRRPLLSLSLVTALLGSLAAVSFALVPASKPRPAAATLTSVRVQRPSPPKLTLEKEPAPPAAQEEAAAPIVKVAPQAARPKRVQPSAAREAEAAPGGPAPTTTVPAPSPPDSPSTPEGAEVPYRFPRRALKSVF